MSKTMLSGSGTHSWSNIVMCGLAQGMKDDGLVLR